MKRLLFLLTGLCCTAAVSGQIKARIEQEPYTQQVTSDGFTVVWSTDNQAAAWVEVAPNDGTHFYATERPKYYQSHMGRRCIGTQHAVRVEGLTPGKTYRYRAMHQAFGRDLKKNKFISGDNGGSDVYRGKPYIATTLDPAKEQTEFWVVNDIHSNDSLLRTLLSGAEKAKPDFICMNGDMASSMDSAEQIAEGYLSTISKLSTTTGIPVVFARGNHETRGLCSDKFLDYFPTTTGEPYYAFRQGPAFILVLDGGEDKPDSDIAYQGLGVMDAFREQETKWLKQVVESDEFRSAPMRIVVIHMPSAVHGGWHGDSEVRRLFVPILNQAGIDLMLCGHFHRYSYTTDNSRGTNFPILVNSNKDKLVVKVNEKGINAKVVDASGRVIKEHKIDRKYNQ